MKLQYLRAFIVLLAGLIALIVNIKTHKEVTVSLFIVLVVIIIFYFVGTLIVEIMQKALEGDSSNPELEIINEDEDIETEEVHVSFDDEEEETE
ncbi:MAG: hypothetical protein ACI4GW_13705 [Lachnospiraceae bacterium]